MWTRLLSLTFLFVARLFCASETPPNFLWVRQAGGPSSEQGQAIAMDPRGNVYVTGVFSDTNDFGGTNLISDGYDDIFVAKYDPVGTLLWVRQAGGPDYDGGRGIAVDAAGSIYVVGTFQATAVFGGTNLNSRGMSDLFLAKYNPAGTLLWVRQAGGTDYDEAHALALDAAGSIYLTGSFDANATFGSISVINRSRSSDIFVAKADNTGSFLWAQSAGGDNDDEGNAIAVDPSGNAYVTGIFNGTATFGTTNMTSLGTSGLPDIFVAKYDPNGKWLWVIQAGGDDDDTASGIAADTAGNLFVTGSFTGTGSFGNTILAGNGTDIFLAKYDPTAQLLWARKAGGNNPIYGDAGFGVTVDSTGSAYLVGFFSGTANFGTTNLSATGFDDLFVAKYGGAGDLLWVRKAGGANIDVGYAIAVAGTNAISITGVFYGTAVFGETNLTSQGLSDTFVTTLGVIIPPTLKIGKGDGDLLLTWPLWPTGFSLESKDILGSGIWKRVSASIQILGESNVVSIPMTGLQQFYRLTRP